MLWVLKNRDGRHIQHQKAALRPGDATVGAQRYRQMPIRPQIETSERIDGITHRVQDFRPFFSIQDLAERWRVSRASVYNQIRGEKVLDFAANGRKGHKLVPLDVVLKIERTRMRVLR